jgi:(E)-4-hydroxy-3-methylbut-2-enyl-diphosphate synthase
VIFVNRRRTRAVFVGGVQVGGGAPVSVQSMTKSDTRDTVSTVEQINALAESGCEIIRAAVPDAEAAAALPEILKGIGIPLVADIHFDHRLALEAIKAGVHGLRINPGNIGGRNKVEEVVRAAQGNGIPIRIGVNAGSLEKELLVKYGGVTPAAMVESAMRHVNILEDLNFTDIKLSLKASNVPLMLEAYRLMSEKADYPLHVGVTESGTLRYGTVKSAVGIGILLSEGIATPSGIPYWPSGTRSKSRYDILRAWGCAAGE